MKTQKLFYSCLAAVLTLSTSYPCSAQPVIDPDEPFTPRDAATSTPSAAQDPAEAFTPTGAASSASETPAENAGSSSAED